MKAEAGRDGKALCGGGLPTRPRLTAAQPFGHALQILSPDIQMRTNEAQTQTHSTQMTCHDLQTMAHVVQIEAHEAQIKAHGVQMDTHIAQTVAHGV